MIPVATRRWLLAMLVVWGGAQIIRADDPFEDYSAPARAVVKRMLDTIDDVKTYRDEAELRVEMGSVAMPEQKLDMSFAFARPDRMRLKNMMQEVVSDGKELTVYLTQMRRYRVAPLKENLREQIAQSAGVFGQWFSNASLFLAEKPREAFGEQFRKLEMAGRETIDNELCVLLTGKSDLSGFGMSDKSIPCKLWLRESDSLVRRVEWDAGEAMKEQMGENSTFSFDKYVMIYDVKGLKINEPIDAKFFVFEPPSGAKKVDEFHSRFMHVSEGAERFALSGKPAPEFSVTTLDGHTIDRASCRDDVVVLCLIMTWGSQKATGLRDLEELQERFGERDFTLLAIFRSSADAEDVKKQLDDEGCTFPAAIDLTDTICDAFAAPQSPATVLIGKDGVVQGRYGGFLSKPTIKSLSADIEKLLAGESLPSAKPMTEEDVREAEEQESAVFTGQTDVEPLNDEWLTQRWSVRASGTQNFGFGTSPAADAKGLWVQDRKSIRQIGHDGKVLAEITLGDVKQDVFTQSSFVVGHIGRGLAAVQMVSIPGDEAQQGGYRPPKGARLTAYDESGSALWSVEVEGVQYQTPQHLALADLDGRGGDELAFVYGTAISIVDGRGKTTVRKVLSEWPQWMLAEDRDRDGRAELYVRTQSKLLRYDYAPR